MADTEQQHICTSVVQARERRGLAESVLQGVRGNDGLSRATLEPAHLATRNQHARWKNWVQYPSLVPARFEPMTDGHRAWIGADPFGQDLGGSDSDGCRLNWRVGEVSPLPQLLNDPWQSREPPGVVRVGPAPRFAAGVSGIEAAPVDHLVRKEPTDVTPLRRRSPAEMRPGKQADGLSTVLSPT